MSGLSSCLVVARLGRAGLRPLVDARLRALEAWYAPLGPVHAHSRWFAADRIVVAELAFGGDVSQGEAGGDLVWGAGASVPALTGLLDADDAQLRRLDCFGAFVSTSAKRTRVVSGSGPTALYAAGGADAPVQAWSSHATAAGWLAHGGLELHVELIAELFAIGHVGLGETHLRGVRALPPATCVDIEPEQAVTRSFLTPRQRYELIPEGDALESAERALLGFLQHSLAGAKAPWLGLTAGVDSRALAAAISRLGLPVRAFTWGHADGHEAVGAAPVARQLGIAYECRAPDVIGDDASRARIDAAARWSDGLLRADPLFAPTWPEGISHFVTGNSGEIGRAHTYRLRIREFRGEPPAPVLARGLRADEAIRHAQPDARRLVRDRAATMVERALEAGLRGWRVLDGIYQEERVQTVTRALWNRTPAAMIAPYLNAEVGRAMISMSLEQRLHAALHQRLIERATPSLTGAPEAMQRRGVPLLARRLASEARRRRARLRPPGFDAAAEWRSRPGTREWLLDGVLRDPLLADALGAGWASATRAGFAADAEPATVATLQAAALIAYRDAVAELNRLAQ